MGKNTGKVRNFVSPEKVGTMREHVSLQAPLNMI